MAPKVKKILLTAVLMFASATSVHAAIGTTSARYHPDQFKASVNVSQGVYAGSDATNSLPNVMRLAKAIGFWNIGIWQRGRRDVAYNESAYWASPYVNGLKFHIYNPWEYSRVIYGAGCPNGTDLIPNEIATYGTPTAGENLNGNPYGIAGIAFQQRYSQKQRQWFLNHVMWGTSTDPGTSAIFGSFPQAYKDAFVYGYGTRGLIRDVMWNVQNMQVCEDLTDGLVSVIDAWQAGTGTDFKFGGVGFDIPSLNGYMYTPENGSGMYIKSVNQYPHPSTDCAFTPPATQGYNNYQGTNTCVEAPYRTMDFATVPEGMSYLYKRMRQKLNNKYGTGTWAMWGDAAIIYGYDAFVTDSNYTDEYLARANQMDSSYWPFITPDIMYQEAPHFSMPGGTFDDFCKNTDIWSHNVKLYATQTGIINMDNWYPGTQSTLVARCGETGAWNSWALDFSRRTPSNDIDMPLEFDGGTFTVRACIVMPKVFVAWQNWLDVPMANRHAVYGTFTSNGITTTKATYSAIDNKSTFYVEVFNGFPDNDSLWIATHPDKIQLIDNSRLYKRQLYVVIAGSGTVNNWSSTGSVTIHKNEVVDDIHKINLWWEDTNVSATSDWMNVGKSYKPTAAYNSYGTGYIFFLRTLAYYPQNKEDAGKTASAKQEINKTASSKYVNFD